MTVGFSRTRYQAHKTKPACRFLVWQLESFHRKGCSKERYIDKIFISDQENEADRPTVASVCGNSVVVPLPSRTSYFMHSTVEEQTSRPVLDILSCTEQPTSNIEVID